MLGHIRPARLHGVVGVGIPLVATAAVLLLLRGSFSGYLVLGVWLLFANLTTFAYYGYDKFQAVHAGRRVPEILLHLFAVLGGSLGAYLAMRAFRHKTIKGGFRIVFWFIVLVQLAACAVAAYGLFALDKRY
jgi:uncharacterized membrane protein YsdA (DUF1294 family)